MQHLRCQKILLINAQLNESQRPLKCLMKIGKTRNGRGGGGLDLFRKSGVGVTSQERFPGIDPATVKTLFSSLTHPRQVLRSFLRAPPQCSVKGGGGKKISLLFAFVQKVEYPYGVLSRP